MIIQKIAPHSYSYSPNDTKGDKKAILSFGTKTLFQPFRSTDLMSPGLHDMRPEQDALDKLHYIPRHHHSRSRSRSKLPCGPVIVPAEAITSFEISSPEKSKKLEAAKHVRSYSKYEQPYITTKGSSTWYQNLHSQCYLMSQKVLVDWRKQHGNLRKNKPATGKDFLHQLAIIPVTTSRRDIACLTQVAEDEKLDRPSWKAQMISASISIKEHFADSLFEIIQEFRESYKANSKDNVRFLSVMTADHAMAIKCEMLKNSHMIKISYYDPNTRGLVKCYLNIIDDESTNKQKLSDILDKVSYLSDMRGKTSLNMVGLVVYGTVIQDVTKTPKKTFPPETILSRLNATELMLAGTFLESRYLIRKGLEMRSRGLPNPITALPFTPYQLAKFLRRNADVVKLVSPKNPFKRFYQWCQLRFFIWVNKA